MIDTLKFSSNLFANRDRFIKLRCSVFLMFFEFMILLSTHEFRSREIIVSIFDSIRILVENNKKSLELQIFINRFFSFLRDDDF